MERKTRIALLGECMIELRGQLFGTMQQYFGGDTLNTAVYLARLAADSPVNVADATEFGTDAFSNAMLQGQSPDVAARSGNKIASIVIQHAGAIIPREAMPVFFFA